MISRFCQVQKNRRYDKIIICHSVCFFERTGVKKSESRVCLYSTAYTSTVFRPIIKRLLMCVEKDVQLIVDYIRSDVLYRINGVAYH